METPADRYRRRADELEATAEAVPPDRWEAPSPCAGWTARDVLGHVVDMHAVVLRPVEGAPVDAPAVEADPVGALRAHRAAVEAVLADPAVADATCETPMGPMTVAEHIDRVLSDDVVVHRWDLARATGQDGVIDPRDVERMWATASAIPPAFMAQLRTPGAFGPGVEVYGPEVPVTDGAPLQDRLLGFFGRDPGWTA